MQLNFPAELHLQDDAIKSDLLHQLQFLFGSDYLEPVGARVVSCCGGTHAPATCDRRCFANLNYPWMDPRLEY